MFMEKSKVEDILIALDVNGFIFPDFEMVKANGQLCLLGVGGFSRVYEMKSLKRPQGQYVLKVIGFEKHVVTSENFWDTVRVQYFLGEQSQHICRLLSAREIRVLLDDNGNLQKVNDVEGERWDEDGIHLQFILMEKLEEIISKNRFGKVSLVRNELTNEDEVINFAIQVGQALHYTHNSNVLHRDVKLENIFWDNETECYKLGDFGIAKYVLEGTAETVVYTDGYGAPEIEKYLNTAYNATADIYSFGITLYLLLNEFRFPGSEGYYVNMVQYSPEFVFPAPKHASKEMTRIIRKMCHYYQEDRYQSVAEVLMELSSIREQKTGVTEEDKIELPDMETETYSEEKENVGAPKTRIKKMELTGRAKRKEEECISHKMYQKSSIAHFVGIAIMLTLIMRSLQVDTAFVHNWQFMIFPIMVLVEALLLRLQEFHLIFGGITIVIGIYYSISFGITVPYAILLCGLLTGIPIVVSACATATGLWIILIQNENLQWLDFIRDYDLSWIVIVIVLYMLNHYMMVRINLNIISHLRAQIGIFIFDRMYLVMMLMGVILLVLERFGGIQMPELVQQLHLVRTGLVSFCIMIICMDKKEQINENEMDERGDRERSDTIE